MPSDPRDYRVEIEGIDHPRSSSEVAPAGKRSNASVVPHISVLFECCHVYARVYRSADGSHYPARCPKCGKSVRFNVGENGSDARSFVVR